MAHLTSGHSVFDKGFEYYTFQLGLTGFKYLSESVHDPLITLAGWYLTDPRPARSEIVGITDITPNEVENMIRITLKIKRGHYILSKFIQKHVGHYQSLYMEDFENEHDEDTLLVTCQNCSTTIVLYKESLPQHDFIKTGVTE